MKDFIIMKFVGESVDIFCRMNPKYLKYFTVEGGTKVP
jgi:hypothetical protein